MEWQKLIWATTSLALFALQGCSEKQEATDEPVRGLRAYKVPSQPPTRACVRYC
jgi:hypothetical protein